MISHHFHAWKRNGEWVIATHRKAKPFFHAPTLAGVLDCPQLVLRRDKIRRRGWKP